MPQLLKPDMPAVLERTNLDNSTEAFLLPIYEAGSNAIHSILEKYGQAHVARDGQLRFEFIISGRLDESEVSITDNGSGLDSHNYQEFLRPFTGNKLRRGGKGFGRFIAFKVFDSVTYLSLS